MGTNTLNPVKMLQAENSRLRAEVEALRDEVTLYRNALNALRTLHEVTTSINQDTDVMGLVDSILESCLTAIGAQSGSLILLDEESQELVFAVVLGEARERLTGHRLPIGTGIAGWVAQHGGHVMVPNVHLDPRFSHTIDETFHFRTHSMLCVPLAHQKRILGVLQAINKLDGGEFDGDDLVLLLLVAQMATTAIAQAEELWADDVD